MALYTVHLPPETGDRVVDAQGAVFVPEAFSWGALIFGPLWLLINRAWFGLLVWLAFTAVMLAAGYALHPPEGLISSALLVIAIFFGFEGRQLKRLRPAPQGRGHRIRKRSNHITLTVGPQRESQMSKKELNALTRLAAATPTETPANA